MFTLFDIVLFFFRSMTKNWNSSEIKKIVHFFFHGIIYNNKVLFIIILNGIIQCNLFLLFISIYNLKLFFNFKLVILKLRTNTFIKIDYTVIHNKNVLQEKLSGYENDQVSKYPNTKLSTAVNNFSISRYIGTKYNSFFILNID